MEKKIDKFLKKIGKKDPKKMFLPMVWILVGLVFLVVIYTQITSLDILRLKLGKEETPPNYALEAKLREMVKGYPIEKMVSQIARKDEVLAGYLIAVAKKESNWGERVPVLNGEDCYNYWGYRGIRESMGSGGHTCFNSPMDAVNTVSRRLSYFIKKRGLEKPEDLIVWKCGSSCATHDPESVQKWIADVSFYYHQVVD